MSAPVVELQLCPECRKEKSPQEFYYRIATQYKKVPVCKECYKGEVHLYEEVNEACNAWLKSRNLPTNRFL